MISKKEKILREIQKEIIKPQPNEKNPIIVDNYPYGFKRTKIRYWVESVKKKGDRFVSQTLNPKTNLWNKPKKSTYQGVIVVFKNEKGYITYNGLYWGTDKEEYQKFINFFGDLELNELQKEQLRVIRAYIKGYENVTFKIKKTEFRNKHTGEIKTQIGLMDLNDYEKIENEEEKEEQKQIKEQINKTIAYNYHKDKGVLN